SATPGQRTSGHRGRCPFPFPNIPKLPKSRRSSFVTASPSGEQKSRQIKLFRLWRAGCCQPFLPLSVKSLYSRQGRVKVQISSKNAQKRALPVGLDLLASIASLKTGRNRAES